VARKRVVALAALWTLATGALVATQGCYGRTCEGSFAFYGTKPGEGRMVDANTWESAPIDGAWLHFPGARTWIFDFAEIS
jgi:hypothetical protein